MTEPNAPLQVAQVVRPELPNETIIPTCLVVSEAQWQHLIKRLASDEKHTPEWLALMKSFKCSGVE